MNCSEYVLYDGMGLVEFVCDKDVMFVEFVDLVIE